MFYFTAFYGNKNSLLYYFYLTAYKVFLGNSENIVIKDNMPLNVIKNKRISTWLHDFIAPFFSYISVNYSILAETDSNPFDAGIMQLKSNIIVSVPGKKYENSHSSITIKDNFIAEFCYTSAKTKIVATCVNTL